LDLQGLPLFLAFFRNFENLIFFCFQAFAEKEGVEPPDLLQSTVFKTAAFDRSAISPVCCDHLLIASANIECFFDYRKFFSTICKENNMTSLLQKEKI
jgi:hypothetical protein